MSQPITSTNTKDDVNVSEEQSVGLDEDLATEVSDVVDPTAEAPESADADVADVTEATSTEATNTDAPPAVVRPAPIKIVVDRPIQTVGRRKEAVVRVRLTAGTGQFTLNGRTMDSYFPNKVHQQLIKEPLVMLEKAEAFDIHATLVGGGITGQAGALRLGIARALIDLEPNDRPPLKKAGFLSRDARIKERKKYGLKKARKAPQYSKR